MPSKSKIMGTLGKKETRTVTRKVTAEDVLEEMILIESVLGEVMARQGRVKKDLHEARVILFILLGINMAILGLVLGVVVRALFF